MDAANQRTYNEDDAHIMAEMEGIVGRSLRRASYAVAQQFAQHFAGTGIRPALYTILSIVERFPGIAGRRISLIMEVPHANVVVALKELEALGLVIRTIDPGDRRAQHLHLTEAGAEKLQHLHQLHRVHLDELDAQMTPEEREVVLRVLKRLWRGTPA